MEENISMSIMMVRPTDEEFIGYMKDDAEKLKNKKSDEAKDYARKFLIDAGIIDNSGNTVAELNWGGYV